MNYFHNTDKNQISIRKRYLELCKQYHPDITKGETEAQMKVINDQYDNLLKSINGEETTSESGKKHYYKYDAELEANLREMIRKVQNLRMANTVSIALIGSWLWITGDTKPYREMLKFIGCKWHSEKLCWFWHGGHYYRRSAKSGNFAGMAMRYGYSNIANRMNDSGKKIAA